MLKYLVFTLIFSSLIAGVIGIQSLPPEEQEVDHIVIAVATPIRNLFPPSALDPVTQMASSLVHEPLAVRDEHGELLPVLAERWYPEDGGRIWYVHLRGGVTWHDGSPFTADDVQATYRHIQDAADPPSPLQPMFADLLEVEVVHSQKLRLVFQEASGALPELVAMPIASTRTIDRTDHRSYNFRPVGTGPFVMDRWSAHGETILVANDEYWSGEPGLDSIGIIPLGSADLRRRAVQTGAADVALNTTSPETDDLVLPTTDVVYLAVRDKPPFLVYPEARRAISITLQRAWNQDEIDHGTAAAAPWPPTSNLHIHGTPPHSDDDPETLLEAVGWSEQAEDGTRVSGSNRAEFELLAPAWQEFADVAEWISDTLLNMGIAATPEIEPLMEVEARLIAGRFSTALIRVQSGPDGDLKHLLASGAPYNDMRYRNPEMDLLLEKLRAAPATERRTIGAEIARVLARDTPAVWLYHPRENAAVRDEISGLQWGPGPVLIRPEEIRRQD